MVAFERLCRRTMGLGAALALAAASAGAQTTTWTTTLSGPAEAPPNASPGTGSAVVTLTGNSLTVTFNWSNLLAGTTASHIHCCTSAPFTGMAGVATMVPTFVDFPLGVTSGSYSRTFDLLLASTYNPAFLTTFGGDVTAARDALVNGMNSGVAYLNIHSQQFPGGEIRGFLTVVPEPGTMVLLGTGLAGLGGAIRRRRGPKAS